MGVTLFSDGSDYTLGLVERFRPVMRPVGAHLQVVAGRVKPANPGRVRARTSLEGICRQGRFGRCFIPSCGSGSQEFQGIVPVGEQFLAGDKASNFWHIVETCMAGGPISNGWFVRAGCFHPFRVQNGRR